MYQTPVTSSTVLPPVEVTPFANLDGASPTSETGSMPVGLVGSHVSRRVVPSTVYEQSHFLPDPVFRS
jgi:hypothetical protein